MLCRQPSASNKATIRHVDRQMKFFRHLHMQCQGKSRRSHADRRGHCLLPQRRIHGTQGMQRCPTAVSIFRRLTNNRESNSTPQMTITLFMSYSLWGATGNSSEIKNTIHAYLHCLKFGESFPVWDPRQLREIAMASKECMLVTCPEFPPVVESRHCRCRSPANEFHEYAITYSVTWCGLPFGVLLGAMVCERERERERERKTIVNFEQNQRKQSWFSNESCPNTFDS